MTDPARFFAVQYAPPAPYADLLSGARTFYGFRSIAARNAWIKDGTVTPQVDPLMDPWNPNWSAHGIRHAVGHGNPEMLAQGFTIPETCIDCEAPVRDFRGAVLCSVHHREHEEEYAAAVARRA